jgi:hypothetical protein
MFICVQNEKRVDGGRGGKADAFREVIGENGRIEAASELKHGDAPACSLSGRKIVKFRALVGVERSGKLLLRIDGGCRPFRKPQAVSHHDGHIVQAEDARDDGNKALGYPDVVLGAAEMGTGARVFAEGELHPEGFAHGGGADQVHLTAVEIDARYGETLGDGPALNGIGIVPTGAEAFAEGAAG